MVENSENIEIRAHRIKKVASWFNLYDTLSQPIGIEFVDLPKKKLALEVASNLPYYQLIIALDIYIPLLKLASIFGKKNGELQTTVQMLTEYLPDVVGATKEDRQTYKKDLVNGIHDLLLSPDNKVVEVVAGELDFICLLCRSGIKKGIPGGKHCEKKNNDSSHINNLVSLTNREIKYRNGKCFITVGELKKIFK